MICPKCKTEFHEVLNALKYKNKNSLDLFFYIGLIIFFALLFTFNLFEKAFIRDYLILIILFVYYIGKFVARFEVKEAIKLSHEVDYKK